MKNNSENFFASHNEGQSRAPHNGGETKRIIKPLNHPTMGGHPSGNQKWPEVSKESRNVWKCGMSTHNGGVYEWCGMNTENKENGMTCVLYEGRRRMQIHSHAPGVVLYLRPCRAWRATGVCSFLPRENGIICECVFLCVC
jgi:hypothetical protein